LKQNDNILETSLEVSLQLFDNDQQLVWEYQDSFPIQINVNAVEDFEEENIEIDIPMVITENLDNLKKGTNKLFITLKNTTGGAEQKKIMEFQIK
jgi:hypothetical protein